MARPGLMRHRKFARLARLIGSPVAARGHLELLWDVAYEAGDELLGDAGDVEYLAGWTGEPGALASALVESGFIDETGQGLIVHDLWDHAPEYVRKRRSRESERRDKGARMRDGGASCPPNGSQCPPKGSQCPPNGSQCPPNGSQCPPNGSQCPPNGRPRTPTPTPTQRPPPPTSSSSPDMPAAPVAAAAADEFDQALWEALQAARADRVEATADGLGARPAPAPPEARRPKVWRAALAEMAAEVGCGAAGVEDMLGSYWRYLHDAHFAARGWPTAVFCAREVWESRLSARARDAPGDGGGGEACAEGCSP